MNRKVTFDEYKKFLDQAAHALIKECGVPIDIGGVCKRLNIRVLKKKIKEKAHGVHTQNGFEIHLRSDLSINRKEYTPFEKFLIAHEIGHFILSKDLNQIPIGKSDYWKHEYISDYFARSLLIPKSVAKRKLQMTVDEPYQRYNLTINFEKTLQVNWHSVAHRVTEIDGGVIFFQLKHIRKENIPLFIITMSTLPGNRLIRSKVKSDDKKLSKVYNDLDSLLASNKNHKKLSKDFCERFMSLGRSDERIRIISGIGIKFRHDTVRIVIKIQKTLN